MLGVEYYVTWENGSFTNALGDYDFVELTPADEGGIQVVGIDIEIFETGDSQEEFLRAQWFSDNATSGNGASTTPRPVNPAVVHANVFTAETVASTPASTGSAIGLQIVNLASRGGTNGPVWYPEGFGPIVTQADTMLCLRLLSAVADDIVASGTVYVRMLG